MGTFYKVCNHSFVVALFLCFFGSLSFGKVVLQNDDVIGKRVVDKVEIMGKELRDRTGVNTYIAVTKTFDGKSIKSYENKFLDKMQKPFILLALASENHQVDIFASEDMLKRFDKDAVLSPYPWSGTIIPILTRKKGDDKYSAAILNGYADIVDQVADSYDVKLDSSIGNANKTVIGVIRFIFYGFIIAIIVIVLYYKRKKRVGRAK